MEGRGLRGRKGERGREEAVWHASEHNVYYNNNFMLSTPVCSMSAFEKKRLTQKDMCTPDRKRRGKHIRSIHLIR